MDTLPNEIILEIFSFLPFEERRRLSRVCKKWQTIAEENILWKAINLSKLHKRYNLSSQQLQSLVKPCTEILIMKNLQNEIQDYEAIFKVCQNVKKIDLTCDKPFSEQKKPSPWTSGEGLKAMAMNCKNIEVLNLTGCYFDENITLGTLKSFLNSPVVSKIKDLGLGTLEKFADDQNSLPPIGDLHLAVISSNCKLLENLTITCGFHGQFPITDNGIILLSEGIKHLRSLNLRCAFFVTDNGMKKLLHHCTDITKLNLRCAGYPLTDKSLIYISNLKNLSFLDISCQNNISSQCFRSIIDHCRSITQLDICYCKLLSVDDVSYAANNLPPLTKLGISGFDGLTDEHVEFIFKKSPNLTLFGFGGCDLITDKSLLILQASNCLRSLVMHKLHVSYNSIENIVKNCKTLRKLDISDCPAVKKSKEEVFEELQQINPKIKSYF